MKRVRITCYLSLYVIFFGGLFANPAASQSTIKVGQITDFTNPAIAVYANKMRNAIQMGIKEINDEGGVLGRKLELLDADAKSDTTLAVSHARRLKAKGIIAIIGGTTSSEALALGKWSMAEGNIPVIAGYASSNALNDNPWVFRTFNDTQLAKLGSVVMQKLGKKKVGLLHTTLAYGMHAVERVKKYAPEYGIDIAGIQALAFKAPNATIQAMKLRDAGSEGVIIFDYAVGVATFARALNTIDWHPQFTSSWGNIYNGVVMSSPPTLMNGGVAQSVCDRASPRVQKVIDDYAKYTGKKGDFDDPIMLGYACLLQLVHAIKAANTADDPAAIRDALYKVEMKDLPLGREEDVLTYTRERNWLVPIESHTFMMVKGGKLEPM